MNSMKGRNGRYLKEACPHKKGHHIITHVLLFVIVAVISQVNVVTNVSKWVVDSGATRHICDDRNVYTSYTV